MEDHQLRDLRHEIAELRKALDRESDYGVTLALRMKRVEGVLKIVTQFGFMGVVGLATYWGLRFFQEGEWLSLVGVVSAVILFVLPIREALRSFEERIAEREARKN